MRRRPLLLLALCVLALLAPIGPAVSEGSDPFRLSLQVVPQEATVGDQLETTLRLELEEGDTFEPARIGAELGPFSVISGSWSSTATDDGKTTWIWNGRISAFKPGELELPSIRLALQRGGDPVELETEPLSIRIASVLEQNSGGSSPPELSDLKPPASLEPDYAAARSAALVLAAILLLSALMWGLHRRYAARLRAVDSPRDLFQRTPPHVWVYAELQKLLARRLAEEGQIDLFYSELSRILKRYAGGRYRVELMEHTTEEMESRLGDAGAPGDAIAAIVALLRSCDRVKFARELPDSVAWRGAVEELYRIVDTTKPLEAPRGENARGAA